jgi:hypothetical protein
MRRCVPREERLEILKRHEDTKRYVASCPE